MEALSIMPSGCTKHIPSLEFIIFRPFQYGPHRSSTSLYLFSMPFVLMVMGILLLLIVLQGHWENALGDQHKMCLAVLITMMLLAPYIGALPG